jgi:hypothetical protein
MCLRRRDGIEAPSRLIRSAHLAALKEEEEKEIQGGLGVVNRFSILRFLDARSSSSSCSRFTFPSPLQAPGLVSQWSPAEMGLIAHVSVLLSVLLSVHPSFPALSSQPRYVEANYSVFCQTVACSLARSIEAALSFMLCRMRLLAFLSSTPANNIFHAHTHVQHLPPTRSSASVRPRPENCCHSGYS